ncbi:MAG: hypothetical protein WCT08_03760 [Patescibacteria group bacterium]|jgi:hypothetical protein
MPEEYPNDPTAQRGDDEQAELQRKFESRVEQVRVNVAKLYDSTIEKGGDPVAEILNDDLERGRMLYGDEAINKVITRFQALRGSTRDVFIEEAVAAIADVVQAEYFDPEVRNRIMAERQDQAAQNKDHISFGHLKGSIHDFEWHEVNLSNGAKLVSGDKVLEISWPGDEDDIKPTGVRDVEQSLRKMAEYIAEHPEIKAVIAVSWMMSRGIAKRLGFTTIPDVDIESNQAKHVIDWAEHVREDKPYSKNLQPSDVKLGVIVREEFLYHYGM